MYSLAHLDIKRRAYRIPYLYKLVATTSTTTHMEDAISDHTGAQSLNLHRLAQPHPKGLPMAVFKMAARRENARSIKNLQSNT